MIQNTSGPPIETAPKNPVDAAGERVVAELRELLRLCLEEKGQRALLQLRQWAKLTSEAERLLRSRKPRVAGLQPAPAPVIGQWGLQADWEGDQAIDGINANEEGADYQQNLGPALGGLGDQGAMLHGMMGELKGMGDKAGAQNEAREIDAMTSAIGYLSRGKGASERAKAMEARLVELIDKKLSAMEKRYEVAPGRVVPLAPAAAPRGEP